ncbi:65kDa B protein-domain-containing protein [Xylaria arbuscula]|nr:65kDa B protein-domain-containing protein [Xylaria arbuscula]
MSVKPTSGPPVPALSDHGSNTGGTSGNSMKLGGPDDSGLSASRSGSSKMPLINAANFATGSGGGALRSIDEKFNVNPFTGTLSLGFQLPVTPGRGGLQPSLSLAYDSGSGNGPFGIGWGVSVDSINRKTSRGVPTYDDRDVFILSGTEDLVAVDEKVPGRHGDYAVTTYRPRVEEEVVRIERFTNTRDYGDVYWRTISSSNVTKIFGRTDQSRIYENVSPSAKRITSWLLCETYDASGNAIIYSYKSDSAVEGSNEQGEGTRSTAAVSRARYIKSIKYGNRSPCRDLETWSILPWKTVTSDTKWMFEVVFDYGEHDRENPTTAELRPWDLRRDIFSTYKSGFEVRTSRLCRRTLMFHHIPEKLNGVEDYLVSSVSFDYDERTVATFLQGLVQSGHMRDDKGFYSTQNLAPLRFDYCHLPDAASLEIKSTRPTCLQTLLSAPPGSVTQWVDLESEGLTGLLVQLDGSWYYQRNENAVNAGLDHGESESDSDFEVEAGVPDSFGTIKELKTVPNLRGLTNTWSIEDLEADGTQNVVITDNGGRLDGYYTRLSDGEWATSQAFTSVPNVDLHAKDVRRLDLTGNGQSDVLISNDASGELMWHESLGRIGLGPEKRCQYLADGTGNLPRLISNDGQQATYVMDMSGDGLSDIVQVSNGCISYWPNMGHGRFGSEIIMLNSPRMDSDDQFNLKRVQFLDMDGSGTADLVYLPPSGGLVVYINQCGNSFDDGTVVSCFPRMHTLADIFVADILGNGTSCLCWAGPDGGANNDPTIFYLDITAGRKPYLLQSYTNGCGLTTSVSYRPSTKFYLKDEHAGWKWKTKLPFPIHVVSKVVERDAIALTAQTTRYRYHEGYYDRHEREFRGFGMVESWKSEAFYLQGLNEKPYKRPMLHTKLWFFTGAPEAGLKPTHIFGLPRLLSVIDFNATSSWDRLDTFRALKGKPLRIETYGRDKSTHQDTPFSVQEHSYEIETLRAPAGDGRPGIRRTLQREKLTAIYERSNEEPPRLQHEMILERNKYGDATKVVTVSYGRDSSLLSDKDARDYQEAHSVSYREIEFTKDISDKQDIFYKSQVSRTSEYRVFGIKSDGLYDLATLRRDKCSEIQAAAVHDVAGPTSKVYQELQGAARRVRISESRIYYRSQDMAQRLDLHLFEPFSVVHQSFTLALTPGHLKLAYGEDDKKLCGHQLKTINDTTGNVNLDGDGCLWTPSSRSFFSNHTDGTEELTAARRSFYTPTIVKDPFNNKQTLKMDDAWLFPLETIDAAENVTKITFDYRSMQPVETVDPNGNRTQTLIDHLGGPAAIAVMGKVGEDVGDSIEDVKDSLASDAGILVGLMQNMSLSTVSELLGSASRRTVVSHERLQITDATGNEILLPRCQVDISRTGHHWAEKAAESGTLGKVTAKVSYFDGRGRTIQEVNIVDWSPSSPRWVVSNLGNSIKAYKAFFVENHLPISQADLPSTFPSIMTLRDALDRVTGTVNADGTWSKVTINSWSNTAFDAGAVANAPDPAQDLDLGYHFSQSIGRQLVPSWLQRKEQGNSRERDAASKSRLYGSNAQTKHINPDGQSILVEEIGGSMKRFQTAAYDVHGNQVLTTDSLGRCVQTSQFDMLGNCIATESMDSGRTARVHDCNGATILECNERGVAKKISFDCLRRMTEIRVRDKQHPEDYTWTHTIYGENVDNAVAKNLRGRVAEVRDQSGVRRNVGFDFKGNCVSSTTQLAVDYKSALDWSPGRPAPPLEATERHVTAQYDALNRARLSTDALGKITKREYGICGGLKGVWSATKPARDETATSWDCHVADIKYNAEAQPLTFRWGNSIVTTYDYDSETGRVINKKSVRSADKAVLEDFTYTYDILGRVSYQKNAAHQTVFFRNNTVEPSSEFWYDSFGRLIIATGRETIAQSGHGSRSAHQNHPSSKDASFPGDGRQLAKYIETYKYDDVDNLLEMCHESTDVKTDGWRRTYHYEEPSRLEPHKVNNRLSRTMLGNSQDVYGYDDDAGLVGCLTKIPSYSRLDWDCNAQLRCSARQSTSSGCPETTWYVYDSDGVRVRKVTERSSEDGGEQRKMKETLYLESAELYWKYAGDGTTKTFEKQISQVTHGGTPVPSRSGPLVLIETDIKSEAETPTSVLQRYLLSESIEVDDQGRLVSLEEYSPWGASVLVICNAGIEAPSSYRYAAYQRDVETGLYHCGARYYAPWLGRWLSPDPLGTAAGPNVYAYCNGDPVNYTDAAGTLPEDKKDKRKQNAKVHPLTKNLTDHRPGMSSASPFKQVKGKEGEFAVARLEAEEKIEKGGLMKQMKKAVTENAATTAVDLLTKGVSLAFPPVATGAGLLGAGMKMVINKNNDNGKQAQLRKKMVGLADKVGDERYQEGKEEAIQGFLDIVLQNEKDIKENVYGLFLKKARELRGEGVEDTEELDMFPLKVGEEDAESEAAEDDDVLDLIQQLDEDDAISENMMSGVENEDSDEDAESPIMSLDDLNNSEGDRICTMFGGI